uniref:RING-type E3 ubiquitin transferase n=1 Tax=Oryza meridionalis TaxID=40149 RepID=A0A0E0C9L5_9ORYZ
MVDLAGLSGLDISLAVVALIAAICAISWTVRCLIGRRGEVAADPNGERQGLLNKEEVVIIDVAAATEARGDDVALCAICKGRLAVAFADGGGQPCRRLRPCGHVYHAECIGLWLQRGTTCPVCRADVVASRNEIVGAMA